MKEFFKYRDGYVNIDDEFLYLSSDGNWHNVKQYKEVSRAGLNRKVFASIMGLLFLTFTAFLISGKGNGVFGYAAVVIIFLQLLKMSSPKAKIPLSKIKSFDVDGKSVSLQFTDKKGQATSVNLSGVEDGLIECLKVLFDDPLG